MNNPLHLRTVSGFSLSISTALAFESIFTPRQAVYDPGRVLPPRIPINRYGFLWVNVLTLIRNAYNALDRNLYNKVTPLHMTEVIMQEIELIEDLLKNEGHGLTKPVFYFCDYENFFPKNEKVFTRRSDNTDLQKHARYIFEQSKRLLIREKMEIQNLGYKLPGNGTKNLILTHIPIDLLSYNSFESLDLLESHTGKLKTKLQWGSKYYPVPETDMESLPFCRQLLCAFGDHVSLSPLPIKARRMIIELAKTQRWNPMTSPMKVNTDFNKINDPLLVTVLKSVPLY